MAHSRRGAVAAGWQSEQERFRERGRRRRSATRLAMAGMAFLGGLTIAALIYGAVWLIGICANAAASQTQNHVENRMIALKQR